jgi:hypothetical protein
VATYDQRLDQLEKRLNAGLALVNGTRQPGLLYVALGNFVRYGCKITQGLSAADLTLALQGAAAGDTHVNPDATSSPGRVEEYANIAFVYGEGYLSPDINASALDPLDTSLVLDAAPTDAGYGRYDIVYVYVSAEGPGQAILKGTASTGAFADFGATGIRAGAYPELYDPAGLPHGAMPIARVYLQTGDTGLANARIVDLRVFLA